MVTKLTMRIIFILLKLMGYLYANYTSIKKRRKKNTGKTVVYCIPTMTTVVEIR